MRRRVIAGLAPMLLAAAARAASPETDHASVAAFKRDFGKAAATNDVAKIGEFLAPDWRVIEVRGENIPRAEFLGVIRDGVLKYESLEGRDFDIRVYGNTAVITGHALAKGSFDGKPFASDEISSEVLVRTNGKWRFVLTHLTKFEP